MIKKDYYRYDELNPRFNILDADLVYWHEKGLLSFVIPQLIQDYIIGGWIKDQGFRGYGVVEYKGLIGIPSGTEKLILEKGKSHIDDCWLLELDKIKYLDDSYRFSVPLPNSLIYSWQPKTLAEIKWDKIPAKRFPTVRKEHSVQPFIKAMESISKKESKPMSYFESDLKDVLDSPYLGIKKQELCITHFKLIELGVIPDETNVLSSPILEIFEKDSRTNDFHDLLLKILRHHPGLSAKKIWILLERDFQMPEDERVYDTHNILRDISGNEIYWVSRHKNDNYFRFSSLAPTLSKLKKLL
jgi:hypothetical protein